jgi:phosphohistidine phosphatase
MKLLIVRHADAGDHVEFAKTGKPDDQRPLSKKGVDQMKSAVDGLKKLVPTADLVVTSPYVRAEQTAEIVRQAYGDDVPLEITDTLEPGRPPVAFETWLRDRGTQEVVVAVGHEPHLGMLATWLTAGTDDSAVDFKKGGACLIVFEKRLKRGSGVLRWLMGPAELKAIG